ncbi:MAG: hypothetical protein DRP35_08625 [Candidatus Zixiibacteriota bacterium]|nr:MAG: hypothetical protein DRP35_08625 [candidate division Zixibacteria bacterium]
MIYIFVSIFILITIVSLLRVRLKFEFGTDNNLLFIGLGKTGPEFDFKNKTGIIKFAGLKLKKFSFFKPKTKKKTKPKILKKEKTKRIRPFRNIAKILPNILNSIWKFFIGLLKSVIVEEFSGQVKAGFDSPDNTGLLFGYYQAALNAVPSVIGRVTYTPVWDEASFNGSVRGSFALPMYKIIFQTIKLAVSLPLRDIMKLAIGRKEGGQDGK